MNDRVTLTKNRLCDAFIDLYVVQDLNKITIQSISDRAGFNRGTFYLYYKDIYDMLEKIENDLLEKVKKNFTMVVTNTGICMDGFFVDMILNFYKENEKYVIPLMIKDNFFVNSLKENLKNIVSENIIFNSNEKKEIFKYLVEYQISAIVGVINMWFKNGKNISLDSLANILYSISNKGVINSFNNIR